ncbi:MAG: 50S ribosome-binding GTPase [Desulfurococcus sp.]|nr:50S ribosome-binding GTPase [Desulfurococcus sp.]
MHRDLKPSVFTGVYIRSYEELLEYVDSRLREIKGKATSKLLSRKLDIACTIVVGELENIVKASEAVSGMHEFFRELYRVYVGEDPSVTARGFRKLSRVARDLCRDYESKLNDPQADHVAVFRSGLGRLLSLYKRKARTVSLVKKYVSEVSRMPDVSGDYRVVIAGMPQVGKSTLLSKLTRAKPEIGAYPFTTRSLIVGHVEVDYGRIVLIDSPGLLDSRIEEKNIIEKRAILAVKHLADHLLFVFDVNPSFYYSLEEQLRVYSMVKEILGDKPAMLVVNKIDSTPREILESAVGFIESRTGLKPILISALLGLNLDLLKKKLYEAFTSRVKIG